MVMFHSYVSLLEGTNHKIYQIPAGGIGDVFPQIAKTPSCIEVPSGYLT